MGLTKLLKGKPLSEEEKTHRAKVKEAYDKAYREAELKAAEEQGKQAGAKAIAKKQNSSLLGTIGRVAEGMYVGINKGADAFNKGVGVNTL